MEILPEPVPGQSAEPPASRAGKPVDGDDLISYATGHPHLFALRMACRIGFKLYFATCALRGREHIPPRGTPYVLALNHRSHLDPGLIWAYFPEPVYFIYREELNLIPLFGWAARELGHLAIRRGEQDVKGFRGAVKYLTELKRNVGIFIEGRRVRSDQVEDAKDGCALLAARSGAPVLPVFIAGTGTALPKGSTVPTYIRQLSINVGPPVRVKFDADPPRREDLEEATGRIAAAINRLDPEGPSPRECSDR